MNLGELLVNSLETIKWSIKSGNEAVLAQRASLNTLVTASKLAFGLVPLMLVSSGFVYKNGLYELILFGKIDTSKSSFKSPPTITF